MNTEYIKYKSFYDLKEAEDYKEYISKLGCTVKLSAHQKNLTELQGDVVEPKFSVLVLSNDVSKINRIIEIEIQADSGFLNSHYCNDFNQEELKDIVTNASEWSFEDYIVAKNLLIKLGIDPSQIDQTKLRIQDEFPLRKKVSFFQIMTITFTLVLGSMFISSAFILGMILQGIIYYFDKSCNSNEIEYYTYTEEVRGIGAFISFIGICYFSITVFSQLSNIKL